MVASREYDDAVTDLVFPLFGPLAWIDVVVLIWIVLALLSAAYVAWDAFTQNPELTVIEPPRS